MVEIYLEGKDSERGRLIIMIVEGFQVLTVREATFAELARCGRLFHNDVKFIDPAANRAWNRLMIKYRCSWY